MYYVMNTIGVQEYGEHNSIASIDLHNIAAGPFTSPGQAHWQWEGIHRQGNEWQDKQSHALDVYAKVVRHDSGLAQKAWDYFVNAYQAWLTQTAGYSEAEKKNIAWRKKIGAIPADGLKASKDPDEKETLRACMARLNRAIAKQSYPDALTELSELCLLTGDKRYYQFRQDLIARKAEE